MRQWDTKKQFKPDYKAITLFVFFGLYLTLRKFDWRTLWFDLRDAFTGLTALAISVMLPVLLLATFPLSLPLMLFLAWKAQRVNRLHYLRSNRKADEDI